VVSLLLLCFFFDTAYEAAAEGNFPDEIGTWQIIWLFFHYNISDSFFQRQGIVQYNLGFFFPSSMWVLTGNMQINF
jgi:hypothetical protein